MFYGPEILRRGGRFSCPWLAATCLSAFKKHCSRRQIIIMQVPTMCNSLIDVINSTSRDPKQRYSLMLSAQLMYGITCIYKMQVEILAADCWNICIIHRSGLKRKVHDDHSKTIRKKLKGNNRTLQVTNGQDVPTVHDAIQAVDQQQHGHDFQNESARFLEQVPDPPIQNLELLLDQFTVSVNDITLRDGDLPSILRGEARDDFGPEEQQTTFIDFLLGNNADMFPAMEQGGQDLLALPAPTEGMMDLVPTDAHAIGSHMLSANMQQHEITDIPDPSRLDDASVLKLVPAPERTVSVMFEETPTVHIIRSPVKITEERSTELKGRGHSTPYEGVPVQTPIIPDVTEIQPLNATPVKKKTIEANDVMELGSIDPELLNTCKKNRKHRKLIIDKQTRIPIDTTSVNVHLRCERGFKDIAILPRYYIVAADKLLRQPFHSWMGNDMIERYIRCFTKRFAASNEETILQLILGTKEDNVDLGKPGMALVAAELPSRMEPEHPELHEEIPTTTELIPPPIPEEIIVPPEIVVCEDIIIQQIVPEQSPIRHPVPPVVEEKSPDLQSPSTGAISKKRLELTKRQWSKTGTLQRLCYLWEKKVRPITMLVLCPPNKTQRFEASYAFMSIIVLKKMGYVRVIEDHANSAITDIKPGPKYQAKKKIDFDRSYEMDTTECSNGVEPAIEIEENEKAYNAELQPSVTGSKREESQVGCEHEVCPMESQHEESETASEHEASQQVSEIGSELEESQLGSQQEVSEPGSEHEACPMESQHEESETASEHEASQQVSEIGSEHEASQVGSQQEVSETGSDHEASPMEFQHKELETASEHEASQHVSEIGSEHEASQVGSQQEVSETGSDHEASPMEFQHKELETASEHEASQHVSKLVAQHEESVLISRHSETDSEYGDSITEIETPSKVSKPPTQYEISETIYSQMEITDETINDATAIE